MQGTAFSNEFMINILTDETDLAQNSATAEASQAR